MANDRETIAVFFTHGVSLELWDKRGMFSREVRFYKDLAQQIGEVWFFTYGRNDARYRARLGTRIHLFPKRFPIPNLLYGLLLPFLYWKQVAQADLLRVHQMAGSIPAIIARWLFRKPLVVRCGYQWSIFLKRQNASAIKQWVVKLIEFASYQSADSIILATEEDADYVSTSYAIPKTKINIVPNYVDTNLFKPMDFEKEKNSVCFVGRLESQKNLVNLIRAAQGTESNLIFYGEGSLRDELQKLAHELGVYASFRGRISNEELPKALNACEIFILPSWHEGNPKALLEAMSCGLPVVGTNVEGISSIIRDNENGLLCETESNSIQSAIKKLSSDVNLRDKLGKSAREMIESGYSLQSAIEKEKRVLHKIGI